MRESTVPLACGHPAPIPPADGPAGYVILSTRRVAPDTAERAPGTILPTGARICYGCADALQRRDIETADAVTVYDATGNSGYGRTGWRGNVTTWTGGYLGTVIGRSVYRNGLTGSRMTALTVRTAGGRILHGRYGSDWSQAVTLRPSRSAR